jgi:hypothetical protein
VLPLPEEEVENNTVEEVDLAINRLTNEKLQMTQKDFIVLELV